MGALTKLDEFLSNQQIHTHFETVPGTFRNTSVENQETNEDDSQSDHHPEAVIFRSQTTQNSGPEFGHDMVAGVTEDIRNRHDLVTGVTEDIRNRHDMVKGVTEDIRNRHDLVTGVTEDMHNRHDTQQPKKYIRT